MKFRAAFTWGKVLGRTFRGHGRAALVAESSMQAKWARLERCAVVFQLVILTKFLNEVFLNESLRRKISI